MRGAFTTELAEDEIIEAVEVPRLSGAARWGYAKFCRKSGEFPEAGAAVMLDPERRVAHAFLGALDGAPRACPDFARHLAAGAALEPERAAQAVATIVPDLDAVQRRMLAAMLHRAARQALGT
jgi:carbon-monoxide dehydrogenase medium subunit